MSIEHLSTTKTAQFFRPNTARRLSGTAVGEIIKRAAKERVGQFEDRIIRQEVEILGESVFVSYACWVVQSEPAFLRGSPLRDEKHAYLLIVEAPEAIAVFKRNAVGVTEGLSPFVIPWAYENLGGAFVDDSSAYERITLRSMSLGGNVVKRRSLEADDLSAAMATAGVHRSIPGNFRTRSNAGVHTITPGSGRIARRDVRSSLEDLLRWVRSTGAELNVAARNYESSFLAQFSRAVPLSELPPDAAPSAIMFDLADLRDDWEDRPTDFEFYLKRSPRSATERRLSDVQIAQIFDLAEEVFVIEGEEITYTTDDGKRHVVGHIRRNKNTISVRGEFLDRVRFTDRGGESRLSTYANAEGRYVITFTNPEFGYSEGQLFRDTALIGSIDSLLRIFEAQPGLTAVTDEKDVLATGFGRHGVFNFVEVGLASNDDILVCDDLGDEWADYIILNVLGNPPRLGFVHCKHGDVTSSASAMHVPIGQAIKNLSRMFRPLPEFEAKLDSKWAQPYNGLFPRIRGGRDVEDVRIALTEAISDPNTQRDVILVLSSISLAHLRVEFDELRAGTARPHVSQLLWLLATLVASCREHGVSCRIVCQP